MSWTRISMLDRGLSLSICLLLEPPAPALPRGTKNPPGAATWGRAGAGVLWEERPECHRAPR